MKKRARTEKSKYKHKSNGDYCTCAAYVAEILCANNAQHQNKGSLPYKFWNIKPWDWTFKKQVILARKFIKKYSEEALVKAVSSPEFSRTFSLNSPRAEAIVRKYHEIIKSQAAKEVQVLDVIENAKTSKKKFGKKSGLSKLREIEKRGKRKNNTEEKEDSQKEG
jgi:hypothetical protein